MTCAKQTVVAVIMKAGKVVGFGTNECSRPQEVCPRGELPTGKGYHLCERVCGQLGHAEVNACADGGDAVYGGVLHLFGHSYICGDCRKTMELFGVTEEVG